MLKIAKTFAVLFFVLFAFGAPTPSSAQNAPSSSFIAFPTKEPVSTAAYGLLFDENGKEVEPTEELLRTALDFYIKRLTSEASKKVEAALQKKTQVLKDANFPDEMTEKFLLLEWLSETVAPVDVAQLYAKNRTMRMAWYKLRINEKEYWNLIDKATGLPKDLLEKANKGGFLRKATMSTGQDYINECKRAGVPIPPTWGEEGPGLWNHVGNLTTNFLGKGNPTKVYRFDGKDPEGLCVALPRIEGNTIKLLGVICMGKKSSNVCFFDNSDVPVGEKVPMKQFLSGGNLGDVCSDCHAGENPFIVHPNSPLDMAPANHPDNWYTPLVRPNWPQNPGPSPLLSQVTIDPLPPVGDDSCLTCHYQQKAGRFPDILELNRIAGKTSGYCSAVVLKAIGDTMPGSVPFQKHVNAMRAFCGQSTPPGTVVDNPKVKDDPKVISPPIVIGPLYACAQAVEVRGALYGAKLVVRVNGVDKATVQVTKPSSTMVQTGPLWIGDKIDAFQDVNGTTSNPSASVIVQDHQVAYPNGLPAPNIDPVLVHECGRVIAVRHIRGAEVTILTNNTDAITYGTASDWTNLAPKVSPFKRNDSYTARQMLCKDTSATSAAVTAVAPPIPMPSPAVTPLPIFAGQQLININNLANGALTRVNNQTGMPLSEFSTAIDRITEVDVATKLGRPLKPGDNLNISSELCKSSKVEIPTVNECRPLQAPDVTRPFVGDLSLTINTFVPGAKIRVFDAALLKIGEGSGSMVGLTRPVAVNDVLTVMQSLGTCQSAKSFQVTAICAGSGCK